MRLRPLYEKLSTEQREQLAAEAGISAAYLWQLATQWNGKKPSLDLLASLAKADKRLTVKDLVEEFTSG